MLDLILVGGGLANGLLAWRLAMTRPDVSFALLEAGPSLGGNHTWCFHGTDVTRAQLEWLWVLCSKSWPSHDVVFSGAPRRLGGGYHAIRSEGFHGKLAERLGDRVRLRAPVRELSATSVTLATGETLAARAVIDGRGISAAPAWPCGYQKSVGLDVELEAPHALEVPLLMDARVAQLDGFRFVSLLPWDERRLLVEDTAYTNDAHLDLAAIRARALASLAAQGLTVRRVLREEAAALPIPLGGAAPTLEHPVVGVPAGLFHASTGASLPMAVDVAHALPQLPALDAASLTAWLSAHAQRHWASQGFYRMLNRVLFTAAEPEARVRLFEAFYAHGEGTVARFSAGTLTPLDKLKILARAAPTVPGLRAVHTALKG